MSKILKCPFCDTELMLVKLSRGNYYCHSKTRCIARALYFDADNKDCIQLWNTRKPMEKILDRLGEEIKKCDRTHKEHRYNFYVEGMSQARDTKYGISKAIRIIREEGEL